MKYSYLIVGCLLLSPCVRADVTPNQEAKAKQINMDLKQDIIDQPDDSKKITKLRGKLRDAYADYAKSVRDNGSGTPKSRKAASKVIAVQKELHSLIDKPISEPVTQTETTEPETPPAATTSSKDLKEDQTMTEPPAARDSEGTDPDDDKLYSDIVKQYGADSPQAEAARRQFHIKSP